VITVDSSVWVANLRDLDTSTVRKLAWRRAQPEVFCAGRSLADALVWTTVE